MNRKRAFAIAKDLFNKGKPAMPTGFSASNGVVCMPVQGTGHTLVLYGKDLDTLRMMIEVAQAGKKSR